MESTPEVSALSMLLLTCNRLHSPLDAQLHCCPTGQWRVGHAGRRYAQDPGV